LKNQNQPRLESRVRKPKSETIQRDINNTASKTRAKITKLDVEDSEKNARRSMLKRLGVKVMGNPARKRGVEAGDQDVFDEHAQNILDGNLEEVETFIAPFEEQMGGRQERDFKAQARRDQRAKRLGKTDAEILKYRAKGDKHPMEGRMTYPFAQEEINRQEEAGEITPEEAEIRRLAVNNVRRVYAGKAGPTVKRTITEATYGIGNYEDLVPWSEVYTEEQTVDMEERAEIAQAEATRTRYDPTDITEKQKQDLLKDPVTARRGSVDS
jgi:phosphoribosylformylglycinamidine (FGAM) synthase PurS component